ncbi:MAG: peptide-methionine (S)-S-oxide reductase MsrA [Deltaproteobacteria bacterium]|nr:peptide-methionine (S)-S-oxide reductase MsrA [Deltaproteobacteria bacterium]
MNSIMLTSALVVAFGLSLILMAPTGAPAAQKLETAIFAGGCFWCMEAPFDSQPGVISVTPGYTGGSVKDPTYEQVSAGGTGHAESVQIVYDPLVINYNKLLEIFWHNIDPTVTDRQFCDRGHQYRSAIFYQGEAQRKMAEESKTALEKAKPFQGPVVTEISPASPFYPAEEYHRHYYQKNPLRYKFYRTGCGRDRRLKELWGSAAGH